MVKINHFSKSIDERKEEVENIRKKYPDKVCIFLEKNINCTNIKIIDKNKYLCPKDMLFSQYMYIIRKRLNIGEKESIIFFINNTIPNTNASMLELYEKNKSEDNFLYIKYSSEEVFG